jgi:hypothetical protein
MGRFNRQLHDMQTYATTDQVTARFHQRLDNVEPLDELSGDNSPPGSTALILADLLWFLSIVPWVIFFAVMLSRGQWPGGITGRVIPVCSTFIAAIFAIVDVAVMESIQQRFISQIRKRK